MARFQTGVSLFPQATTVQQLRASWSEADALGADSIWIWDHFYPLTGDPEATHFECYSLLGAMAVETRRARIGSMVTCNSYRNPNLLADMARTLDHTSGGRFVLGIGSGWFERDYQEYGYEFGTAPERLRALADALPIIQARLAVLNPPPIGELPILIGGSGEKVTLKLVARYATMWNTFGPVEHFAHKNAVLNEWCERVGRDPAEIERTVMISADEVDQWEAFVDAGAHHLIIGREAPYDLEPLERLVAAANS